MKRADDIFQQTLEQFLSDLSGKNRSSLTIRCYGIDCRQFLGWIQENDLTVGHPADITNPTSPSISPVFPITAYPDEPERANWQPSRSTFDSWLLEERSRHPPLKP
jgi:hypothetical protein